MTKHAPGSDGKNPPTGAIQLRDVTAGDLPIFFEQQLDPVANDMAAFQARDREAFMAHWSKILVDETVTKKTIMTTQVRLTHPRGR